MLVSVIVDNYNYDAFIGQAIDSVLAQSYTNFELIVVDDGSTDGSREILGRYTAEYPGKIRTIFKQNGGQASAFNEGVAEAKGDIVCFLDSDDYFASNKLEEIVAVHLNGYDYIFTNHQAVDCNGCNMGDTLKRYRCDGYNLFLVYYLSKYPGNVTSTLSISRKLADVIFPLSDENDWRIQADDAIVFQASMMSRAFFLDKKLTNYRVHSNNGHYGKKRSSDYTYELLKKRNRLKEIALKKMNLPNFFLKNTYNLTMELKTHNIFSRELSSFYLRVIWYEMNISVFSKIRSSFTLLRELYGRQN